MAHANVTLLEAIQFILEPLDCNSNGSPYRLLAAAVSGVAQDTVPLGPLVETTWRASCNLRLRPVVLIVTALTACILFLILVRNAFVKFIRWYAAARGSAFVAVATAALRELHATGGGGGLTLAALPPAPPPAEAPGSSAPGNQQAAAAPGNAAPGAATGGGGSSGGAVSGAPLAAPRVSPRPAAAHRWYTPPAISAPVVCCACFQPVVAPQGAEENAQCCELCGMVAHGRCSKAVPHNCRLLALPIQAAAAAAAAAAGLAADGGSGGADAGGAAPPAPPAALALAHDWRPAGTTLDLILPPADTENLLMGTDDPGTGAGGPPSFPAGPAAASCTAASAAAPYSSASASAASCCPSLGPPSLCLYCGEPCEVGLLAVEPVWRCGACRRFAHVQCWSCLHPGVLSAATRAALEGQVMEAGEEMMVPGASPPGASPRWAQQLARPADPSPDPESERGPRPGAGPAATRRPPPSGGAGGGGGGGSSGGGGGGSGKDGGRRRCQSLPNIAGHGDGSGGGGARGSGGGGGGSSGSAAGSRAGGRGSHTSPPARPQPALPATADHASTGAGGGGGYLSDAVGAGSRDLRLDWSLVARLDRCDPQATLGALGAMVLPPTAVVPAAAAAASASGGRSLVAGPVAAAPAGRAGAVPRTASAPPATTGPATAEPPAAAAAAATNRPGSASSGAGAGAGGGGGRSRKKLDRALRQAQKWYRSHAAWPLTVSGLGAAAGDPAGPDRWAHFRVGPLPPGCRPLLVFINPRSGPQVGEQLRRQLLQLLHPMQLVDLSREVPGPALRCWWGVPGLRVLVVGGDGTAGWVLGEMDRVVVEEGAAALAAAAAASTQAGGAGATEAAGGGGSANGDASEAAAGNNGGGAGGGAGGGGAVRRQSPPPPPPVAVLPLGTGNDLARVLGWGGGLAALDARGGVAAVLGEVAGAAPTQLDRWALAVTPTPPEAQRRGRSFLRRRKTPEVPRSLPPPPTQVKLFNNYLGVGIDSWCALEFHRMRERYPSWFRSQLGNKVWYTGVGARDLLARSCVDLPTRMQLVCDGCPVELPPSAQGILLLNIPSYMGGVDLWGNGLSAQQQQQQQQQYQYQQQQYHQQQLMLGPPHPNGGTGAGGAAGKGGEQLHSPERSTGQHHPPPGLPQQHQHHHHHQQQTMTPPHRSASAQLPPSSSSAAAAAGGGATPGASAATTPIAGGRRVGGGSAGSGTPAGSALATSHGPRGADAPHPAGTPGQAAVAVAAGAVSSGGALLPAAAAAGAGPPAAAHPVVPQSMSDGVLEVVAVYGAVHLGQLQVGLARATRLCQCRTAVITTRQALPMQVDGEPWMQPAAQLVVSVKGSATMLRRLDLRSAASRLTAAVGEVLDGAVARGTITPAQRSALGADLARRLGAPHAV